MREQQSYQITGHKMEPDNKGRVAFLVDNVYLKGNSDKFDDFIRTEGSDFNDSSFSQLASAVIIRSQPLEIEAISSNLVHKRTWVNLFQPNGSMLIVPIINMSESSVSKLKEKTCKIHKQHQSPGWDGEEALPIQFLDQALDFIDSLKNENTKLIESAEVVPESDGSMYFEWFCSHTCYITITIHEQTFIYTYSIDGAEGCGETSFSGASILLPFIRKVVSQL